MDGLLILAIESATAYGSISLTVGGLKDGRLLAECLSQPDTTPSRTLLGSIDWLMTTAGVTWSDLGAVAISLGPGSFTGLRIGMAAAKAIAMATGKPLVGVPTLDALALNCSMNTKLLCCLLDARKQEVYAGFYRAGKNGIPLRISEPVAVSPHDLSQHFHEPVILIGPGAQVYEEVFQENGQVEIGPEFLSAPRASSIGVLAGDLLACGEVLDPATASPLYVRASEAQVNLQGR